ncbi:probable cyclin-dependent serine/threonine-protein kinase DDB_G0292550 [Daktulosphaira vitifoliae]|uniref:probable cyclin-dependent serine/threonine-protein kinase DDB_G0292550 n=1 Tax=Daktulosphaira vitifoliae TaxID=58002 RepID=UPI0021A9D35F|nr:probable cyclin-dependent serine/threonine-protein kinase DDB_G0292550 [Daktulosphaira vitifoliae]
MKFFLSFSNEMAYTLFLPAKYNNRFLSLYLLMIFTVIALVFADYSVATAIFKGTHVRRKRTVPDFVEDFMNSVYFDFQDPLPLPSTVIARITHMPTTNRIRYIPMEKIKLTKMRARKLATPSMKFKYPKKYPLKEDDFTASLSNNNLPWTLHPLPPPLTTVKSSLIDAHKNVPWALNPLPPPVKTKSYSDYYWSNMKKTPVKFKRKYRPMKPIHVVEHKPFGSKSINYKPTELKSSDIIKTINFKSNKLNNEKLKSDKLTGIDYKSELNQKYSEEDPIKDYFNNHDQRNIHDEQRQSESSSTENFLPSKAPSYMTTHITIEPSIEIASFSETELQGDSTSSNAVSYDDSQHRCHCILNGHRHKRQTEISNLNINDNGTTIDWRGDTRVERSHDHYSSVGHATEIEVQKSQDISDQPIVNGSPINYEQHVREMNIATMLKNDKVPSESINHKQEIIDNIHSIKDSDKFKINYGIDLNNLDESRSSRISANKGEISLKLNDENTSGKLRSTEIGSNPNKERRFQLTKSKIENSDKGVAFSIQTPFSVASFASNIRYPLSEGHQSQFKYTNEESPQSMFHTDLSEPLDFEQFGLKSAVGEDKQSNSGQYLTEFSKSFGDMPFYTNTGQLILDMTHNSQDKTLNSRRTEPHFSLNFEKNHERSNLFRYNTPIYSNRPLSRLTKIRDEADKSYLEYFQPVIIDFEKSDKTKSKLFGQNSNNNNNNNNFNYFEKSDSSMFPRFKKNDNPDSLRLPGRLHEFNEHLTRKMILHPSTFDID